MSITAIGWIILPATLIILLLRPRSLVGWTIFLAAFQGASVINWSSGDSAIGVQPYFFAALLVVLESVFSGEIFAALADENQIYLTPLILLAAYAIATSFLLPFVFERLPVNNWRAGHDLFSSYQTPLRWSVSNLAQAGYLAIDIGFVAAMVIRARTSRRPYFSSRAFYWSGVIVIAVGLYQELVFAVGLPFPTQFFNSNVAGVQLDTIVLATLGIERLSATFSEPSLAGAFLATWLLFAAYSPHAQKRSGAFDLMLAAGLAALVLTASTTGYATTALVLGALAFKSILRILRSGRLLRPHFRRLTGVAAVVVLAAYLLRHPLDLFSFAFAEKASSVSGVARMSAVASALHLFIKTFGLGAGLGSDNSASLMTSVLANLGVVGMMLFGFVLYRALRIGQQSIRSGTSAWLPACRVAFVTNLVAMTLAISELSWPYFWILLGLLFVECQSGSKLTTEKEAASIGQNAIAFGSPQ